jgi:hypothetical protein
MVMGVALASAAAAAAAKIAQSYMGPQQLKALAAAQWRQRSRAGDRRRVVAARAGVDAGCAGVVCVASEQWSLHADIGATLVRHFIELAVGRVLAQRTALPLSPACSARGMLDPAVPRALVAPSRLAPPLTPSTARARPTAVLLAAVAVRAQQHLFAATRAQE